MQCNTPVFYDCEASSLEGKPIEIGWAFALADGSIVSEAHLIWPPVSWMVERSWDPDAEALHGLSLERLRREGRPVLAIAQRLNLALAGRDLFADDVRDPLWLLELFKEAQVEPTFNVRLTNAKTLFLQIAAGRGFDAGTLERIEREANELEPTRHRAEPDARRLAIRWARTAGCPVPND
jgi:hypothetical protein